MTQNPWGVRGVRYFDVELVHEGARTTYPSVTNEQWAALQDLAKQIRGASPNVVAVASICAYSHGHTDRIPAEQLALIEAHVAAENLAGRRLPGWLTNNCSNRARIG